jgi:acetoacetate decarboxylase
MRSADVLDLPSMPLAGPSYPKGPYRFIDREYMVISYETDPEVVRAQLPEPLEPVASPIVHYEWIRMPDSSGFGSYTETGSVIPCRLRGEEMNFISQMYLDDYPPIAAGREIWGFPKKYAHPKLEVMIRLPARFTTAGSSLPWGPWATSTRAWPETARRRWRRCRSRR